MTLPHSTKVMTFILTRDRAKAKAFYTGTLGFPLISEDPFAAVFDFNGVMMRLSDVSDYVAHPHTVLGWQVDDIAASVRALRAKGVQFQIYPGMGQDELGVWTSPDGGAKVVWFTDPDGNVLSLSELRR